MIGDNQMTETAIIRMIGDEIRRLRKAQHMNLREFAELTGLSNALLSKIENGKVASPISTYIKITNALNISFGDLMNKGKERDNLYIPAPAANPDEKESPGAHGYHFTPIGSEWPNRNFDAFLITYFPSSEFDRPHFSSDVDEFLFIFKGEVEFFHGEDRYILKPGDSLIINANVPHGGRAFGNKPASGVYLSLRRS